jgi:hypothetical protein
MVMSKIFNHHGRLSGQITIAEAATPKVPMNVCLKSRRCAAWVHRDAVVGVETGCLSGTPLCEPFGRSIVQRASEEPFPRQSQTQSLKN